jgi:DNA invertase Pin-like site-specific DNA recombinase
MERIGVYLRVSTFDKQNKGLDSQERALREYCLNHGFKNVTWYRDKMSGSTIDRPAFNKLQKDIFAGEINTVVCWKLDRLSRSLKDGINILTDWLKKDVRVIATAQQLDFSGTIGQMIAGILFAVAQMERENLRENTKRGIEAARAKGKRLGKRPLLFAKDIMPLLQGGSSIGQVATSLNKSRQAIYNCLARDGIQLHELRT